MTALELHGNDGLQVLGLKDFFATGKSHSSTMDFPHILCFWKHFSSDSSKKHFAQQFLNLELHQSEI